MFYIYNTIDPRDDHVFYVGCTHDFRKRVAQHLLKSREPVGMRIVAMVDCGIAPIFTILEIVETEEQGNVREQYWSNHFKAMGMKLLPGSFVGYSRRKTAGRKYSYEEAILLQKAWEAGTGPCPWKDEGDYRRKYLAKQRGKV